MTSLMRRKWVLVHNRRMLSKVVLNPSSDGSARLTVDQITDNVNKLSAGSELRLGTEDLVRLAEYASHREFVVSSFLVADSYLAPLDKDEEEPISDALVESMEMYGIEGVLSLLRDEFDGLYLIGVNLINVTRGLHVSIRRRGYIETVMLEEVEQMLASAWKALDLS